MVRNPSPDSPDTPVERPRVILVEDYDDNLKLMASLLMPITEVVSCRNATEALHYFLDAFRCREHCGILMDVALPDINGIRTMAAIREIERGSTAECVPIRLGVVSGNAELIANTPTFEKLAVTLVLSKPVEPIHFVEKVAAWLKEPAPDMYVPASVAA